MRRLRAAVAIAALGAALGLLLRWESARHEITGAASSCRLSAAWDCDRVQSSAYAHFLGVSLSVWGAAGYTILLLWLLAARRTGGLLLFGAGLLSGAFVLVSAAMFGISYFVLESFCLYCTGMQLCALVLAVLLLPPAWRARSAFAWRPAGLGAVLAAAVLAPALAGDAYAARRSELLRLLGAETGAAVRLDLSDCITLGDPRAPHTVVLFFDFGCPYCRACYHKARRLVRTYPGRVRFVFKHFPLDRGCNRERVDATVHDGACEAAAAGQAAALAGRPELGLEYLFEHQADGFSALVLDGLGKKLGLEGRAWEKQLGAARVRHLVQRDIAEGNALKLDYVPVAYLDGRPIDPNRMSARVARAVKLPAPAPCAPAEPAGR